MIDIKLAKQRYGRQKMNTRGRVDRNGDPILFLLTFEQWLEIWLQSGKYHMRGCRRGQYVMARHNDIGHYEVGNVSIVRVEQNTGETVFSIESRKKMSSCQVGERNPMFGRKHTDDTKKIFSIQRKGKKQSAEHVAKRIASMAANKATKAAKKAPQGA